MIIYVAPDTPEFEDLDMNGTLRIFQYAAVPYPVGKSLMDLERGDCRYVLDDGLFCAAAVETRKDKATSFCKGHAQLVYQRIIMKCETDTLTISPNSPSPAES